MPIIPSSSPISCRALRTRPAVFHRRRHAADEGVDARVLHLHRGLVDDELRAHVGDVLERREPVRLERCLLYTLTLPTKALTRASFFFIEALVTMSCELTSAMCSSGASPFALSVLPVSTRSTMRSASPTLSASSIEPYNLMISTCLPCSAK